MVQHRDHWSWLRRRSTKHGVDGLPFALPEAFDRLSERWWRAHPRVRFFVVFALVALVGAAGTLRLAINPYGTPETVIVATRQLGVGTTLQPGDVERQRWPRHLIPVHARNIGESDVMHSQVVVGLMPGTIITREHIGQSAIAAHLHAAERAVAVPTGLMPSGLAVGARLDLIARDLHGNATRLAADARLIAITDEAVWIAVTDADSPAIAAAAASGTLTATIRPA